MVRTRFVLGSSSFQIAGIGIILSSVTLISYANAESSNSNILLLRNPVGLLLLYTWWLSVTCTSNMQRLRAPASTLLRTSRYEKMASTGCLKLIDRFVRFKDVKEHTPVLDLRKVDGRVAIPDKSPCIFDRHPRERMMR